MSGPFRILILFAALLGIVAHGQTPANVDSAIREAIQRYRGDVPSPHDQKFFREYVQERQKIDRMVKQLETSEAVKYYMKKAHIYRPYLQAIERALPGPARDRAIEDLRRIAKETEITP